MSDEPVFIDVNVPMYAAGRKHPYKEACTWLLSEIADSRLNAIIDTEIIQEILYRYGSMSEWDIANKMALNLLHLIPKIYPITVVDMHTTTNLFARYAPMGVTARDLVHAAVMLNNDVKIIISTDTHFDQIPSIKRIDPIRLYESNLDIKNLG